MLRIRYRKCRDTVSTKIISLDNNWIHDIDVILSVNTVTVHMTAGDQIPMSLKVDDAILRGKYYHELKVYKVRVIKQYFTM